MKKMLSGILLFAVPSIAHGKEEVFLNSLGFNFGGNASSIALSPGYNRSLGTWLQLGGQLDFQKMTFGATSLQVYTLQVGPTGNFFGPTENAFFLSTGLAIRKGNGEVPRGYEDPNGTGFYFTIGKRFGAGRIAYRPSLGIQMAGGTNFLLNLMSIAVFF